MKERPIILKAHEVRGILDGRQTQFRRTIKFQPKGGTAYHCAALTGLPRKFLDNGFSASAIFSDTENLSQTVDIECPFGQVGDRLWGRETWCILKSQEFYSQHDGRLEDLRFAAELHGVPPSLPTSFHGWKSSTQMPRWASRVLLEITAVRVERLQDIRQQDAVAEGYIGDCGCPNSNCRACMAHAPTWFQNLWKSINGADSWSDNPWVWVIEFKCVEA